MKSRVVHYRPARRVPRCDRFWGATTEERVAMLKSSARLTTDVMRVTCSACRTDIVNTIGEVYGLDWFFAGMSEVGPDGVRRGKGWDSPASESAGTAPEAPPPSPTSYTAGALFDVPQKWGDA